MNNIERDIELYLDKIKLNLICKKEEKNRIVSDIRESVYDFVENNNIDDIKKVYRHFGTPEEIAKTYYSEKELEEIKKTAKRENYIRYAIIGAFIIFVIAVICTVANSNRLLKEKYSTPKYGMVQSCIIDANGTIS